MIFTGIYGLMCFFSQDIRIDYFIFAGTLLLDIVIMYFGYLISKSKSNK